jgi:hypothetical protein
MAQAAKSVTARRYHGVDVKVVAESTGKLIIYFFFLSSRFLFFASTSRDLIIGWRCSRNGSF